MHPARRSGLQSPSPRSYNPPMLRVIGGTCRGTRLFMPRKEAVRPLLGRAREALFSILQKYEAADRVLDLFSGSGSLGIEALSRGASHCTFVEKAHAAAQVIHRNLEKTRLADRATVLHTDALRLHFGPGAPIPSLRKPVPYDLLLLDPPYRLLSEAKERLSILRLATRLGRQTLADGAVAVLHHPAEGGKEWEEIPHGFTVLERRWYGTCGLLILEKQG